MRMPPPPSLLPSSSAPVVPAEAEDASLVEENRAFKAEQAAVRFPALTQTCRLPPKACASWHTMPYSHQMEKLLRDLKINIAMKESLIGDLEQVKGGEGGRAHMHTHHHRHHCHRHHHHDHNRPDRRRCAGA